MCTVAAASGAASVRVRHIMSRGWDPWTERPLPEGVRVAYPPSALSSSLLLLVLPLSALSQTATRCVDAKGNVYYGAVPPPGVRCSTESEIQMPKQPDPPKGKSEPRAIRPSASDRFVLWFFSRGQRPSIVKVYDSESQCGAGKRESVEVWRGQPEIITSGVGYTCLPVGVNP